jgi:hypothetical protein
MDFTWQDATAIVIVLAALGYVVRCAVRSGRQTSVRPGCQCCTNCPAEQPEKPLVTLDEVHHGAAEDASAGEERGDGVQNSP